MPLYIGKSLGNINIQKIIIINCQQKSILHIRVTSCKAENFHIIYGWLCDVLLQQKNGSITVGWSTWRPMANNVIYSLY